MQYVQPNFQIDPTYEFGERVRKHISHPTGSNGTDTVGTVLLDSRPQPVEPLVLRCILRGRCDNNQYKCILCVRHTAENTRDEGHPTLVAVPARVDRGSGWLESISAGANRDNWVASGEIDLRYRHCLAKHPGLECKREIFFGVVSEKQIEVQGLGAAVAARTRRYRPAL